MTNSKTRPDWAKALGWAVAVVLAPIWLPYNLIEKARAEIIARRYLKRRR